MGMTPGRGGSRSAAVDTMAVVAGGILGAAVFLALRLPAGGILGALVGSGLTNVLTRRNTVLPDQLRYTGLGLLGAASGLGITVSTVGVVVHMAALLAGALAVVIALSLLLMWWLVRRGMDFRTALFATAPGGIGEVASMAVEAKASVDTVVAFHVLRVVVVVLVALPLLLWFVT